MAQKFLSDKQMLAAEAEATRSWLAWLGPDHLQRITTIDAVFEQRTATIWATCFADLTTHRQISGRERARDFGGVAAIAAAARGPVTVKDTANAFFTVNRSLASMDFRERTYLRFAELLNSAYGGADPAYRLWRAALVWGDGKGAVHGRVQQQGLDAGETADPVASAFRRLSLSVDQTIGAMHQRLGQLLAQNLHPDFRALLQEFADQAAPAGNGSWLRPQQLAGSPYAHRSDYAVHIGAFPDGTPLTYSGDGSIVTVAPPGSGKTQCNVFPNLLTWPGRPSSWTSRATSTSTPPRGGRPTSARSTSSARWSQRRATSTTR